MVTILMAAKSALIVCLLLALGACAVPASLNPLSPTENTSSAASAPKTSNLAWARNDGQLISGSAELTARAGNDIEECGATAPPVKTTAGVAGEACMNSKGYHLKNIP